MKRIKSKVLWVFTIALICFLGFNPMEVWGDGKIVFISSVSGNRDIGIMDDDGSNRLQLTFTTDLESYPVFSPDGEKIAFINMTRKQLIVMNSDGTNQVPIYTSPYPAIGCPTWSPDSAKIAYQSGAYGHIVGNNMYPLDIYIMNADGTDKKRITTYPGRDVIPRWSPNESKILFHRGVEFYVINADGTGEVRLTFTGGTSDEFDWGMSSVKQAFIDIKPGACPNPVNVKSKGVLPVAVPGTEDFDVTAIDPASIRLEGIAPLRSSVEDVSTPYANSQGECDCSIEGEDGVVDLTLKFDTQTIVSTMGEITDGEVRVLTLTGNLFDGTEIEGKGCIVVLVKGGKK